MATSAPAAVQQPPVAGAGPPAGDWTGAAGGGSAVNNAPTPVNSAPPGAQLPNDNGDVIIPPQDSDDIPQKRKATSFKITNVFLSRPPSNDGDDSCEDGEDLEDSHTEDLSDITDLNSFNSLSSQLEYLSQPPVNGSQQPPVVANGPTVTKPPPAPVKGVKSSVTGGGGGQSSKEGQPVASGSTALSRKPSNVNEQRRPSADKQVWEPPPFTHPGFGFVTYHQTGGTSYPVSYVDNTTGCIPVAGTMAVINNVEKGSVSEVPVSSQAQVGPQDFRTRFKIVKVETTEPLKRGRWTCFDLLDKPAAKDKDVVVVSDVKPTVTPQTSGVKQSVVTGGQQGATQGKERLPASRPASTLQPLANKDEQASRRPSEQVNNMTSQPVSVSQVVAGPVASQAPSSGDRQNISTSQSSTASQAVSSVSQVVGSTVRPQEVPSTEDLRGQSVSRGTEVSPAPLSSLSSGSVSEDRELDGGSTKTPHNGRLSGSVPPDGLRGQHASFPSQQASYPTPASSTITSQVTTPHPISLAGAAPSQPPVQSPHTVTGRPEFPQATLGQVVMLPDGQIAQVALVTAAVGQKTPSQQQTQATQQSQPTVMLQPLPTSSSHSLSPQQQFVGHAQGGQQFIVQQPNLNQGGQQQPSSRQQPPPQAVAPQQQQTTQQQVSQQQAPLQQAPLQQAPLQQTPLQQVPQQPQVVPQQPILPQQTVPQQPNPAVKKVSQPQQPSGVQPTVSQTQPQKPIIQPGQSQAGPQTTMQPQQQQPSTTVGQTPTAKNGQQQLPATQPQQQIVGQPVGQQPAGVQPTQHSLPQQNQNLSGGPTTPQTGVATIQRTSQVQSGPVRPTTSVQPLVGSVAQSPVSTGQSPVTNTTSLTTVSSRVTTSTTGYFPVPYSGDYPLVGTGGLDGEGLVERLEDIVSTQMHPDTDGQELEHESASGAGQGSIDNRIEQAMDLVKSHLMSAVRSEVEELRDKISKLEDTVTILSRENEVLRTHVPPDVLASLTGVTRPALSCQPGEQGALQQQNNQQH